MAEPATHLGAATTCGVCGSECQVIKMYGPTPSPAGRYSPAERTGIKKVRVDGA